MQLKETYILVAMQFLLLVATLLSSVWIISSPEIDLLNRPILKWQPGDSFSNKTPNELEASPSLSDAISRPIFRESRRPFEATPSAAPALPAVPQLPVEVVAPAPQAAPLPDTSQFILKGLAIDAGNYQALITTSEKPDGEWYRLGTDVGSWKLVDMNANTVSLTNNDQKITLSLYVDNPAKAVGSP
jgi:hypothetical protein